MAFQPPNTGQERQNRKILEQLEEQKKRLRMQNPGPAPPPAISSSSSIPPGPPMPGLPAGLPPGLPPGLPAGLPAGLPVPPTTVPPGVPAMILPDAQAMTPAQRTALQHATANSVGYFVTQDSSFGNLILPVLPRFADTPGS